MRGAIENVLGIGAVGMAKRFALFFMLWLVISEARTDLVPAGAVVASLTVIVSGTVWRTHGRHARLFAIVAFFPGFVWRSIKGGIDVAWRVLHPRLPIRPAFAQVQCRERDETAQVLLCDVISLMPGTLAAGLRGDRALVHLLVDEARFRQEIADEERRLSRLFEPADRLP